MYVDIIEIHTPHTHIYIGLPSWLLVIVLAFLPGFIFLSNISLNKVFSERVEYLWFLLETKNTNEFYKIAYFCVKWASNKSIMDS